MKKLVNPSLGFKSFHTARRTIMGYEMMNMIRKGQVIGVKTSCKSINCCEVGKRLKVKGTRKIEPPSPLDRVPLTD